MDLPARIRRRIMAVPVLVVMLLAGFAAPASAQFITVRNPVISQRADTAIYKHTDGFYYMTASVPDYKRVELRRATTLQGLGTAATANAFVAPSSGALSGWIWAPDIQYVDGAWYMYFSASPGTARFDQRLYWIRNTCANPMTCAWSAPARFNTGWESFQLDAASFVNRGVRYFVWAQDSPSTSFNSHMYIARMNGPTAITGSAVEIARPTVAWEKEGVAGVVEGPSPLVKNGRSTSPTRPPRPTPATSWACCRPGTTSTCSTPRPGTSTPTRCSRPPTACTGPATAASPSPRTTPPTCSSTTPATTPPPRRTR